MDRMNYPRGLIRYTTTRALESGLDRAAIWKRVLRPRVLIYTVILTLITVSVAITLALRTPFKADIIRDRMLSRIVEDGMIENSFGLQISNSSEAARRFRVSVTGVEGIRLAGTTEFEVGGAAVRRVPLSVRLEPGLGHPGSNPIRFEVEAADSPGQVVVARSTFFVPR
jgi:polyferredoxin